MGGWFFRWLVEIKNYINSYRANSPIRSWFTTTVCVLSRFPFDDADAREPRAQPASSPHYTAPTIRVVKKETRIKRGACELGWPCSPVNLVGAGSNSTLNTHSIEGDRLKWGLDTAKLC